MYDHREATIFTLIHSIWKVSLAGGSVRLNITTYKLISTMSLIKLAQSKNPKYQTSVSLSKHLRINPISKGLKEPWGRLNSHSTLYLVVMMEDFSRYGERQGRGEVCELSLSTFGVPSFTSETAASRRGKGDCAHVRCLQRYRLLPDGS